MRNLINIIKYLGISLALFFSLNNCEPVEEEIKPDYSQLKTLLTLKPSAWGQKINAKMYNAALDLTYPESDFETETVYAKNAWDLFQYETTYTFKNVEIVNWAFKPEEGTVRLTGEFSESGGHYRTCNIRLILQGDDPLELTEWKLESFVPTSP